MSAKKNKKKTTQQVKNEKVSKRPFKRILITTVVPNAKPNIEAHNTLENIAKHFDAEIRYLKTAPLHKDKDNLDTFFDEKRVITTDLTLNQTLFIRASLKIKPHILLDPKKVVSGKKTSANIIHSCTQQYIQSLPRLGYFKRLAYGTGAITLPMYKDQDTGVVQGALSHFYGAMLVEYNSNDHFVHNIQFHDDFTSSFWGIHFKTDGTKRKLKPHEIMAINGDTHVGEGDESERKIINNCLLDIQKTITAETLVLHDLFDGKSVSHHDEDKKITMAKKIRDGKHLLDAELRGVKNYLLEQDKYYKKQLVLDANHNDFLSRWNERLGFTKDLHNFEIGLDSSKAQMNEINPLQYLIAHHDAYEQFSKEFFKAIKGNKEVSITIKTNPFVKNIEFLEKGAQRSFGNIHFGSHGEDGANGSKGNPHGAEFYLGFNVSGHTHSPFIKNRCMNVGTTSVLNPDYARNKPTSWHQGRGLLYCPDGYDLACMQLVIIDKGNWRL